MNEKLRLINELKKNLLIEIVNSDQYKMQKRVKTLASSPFYAIGAFSALAATVFTVGLMLNGVPVPILLSSVTGGLLGAYGGNYMALRNSSKKTKKEIIKGDYTNIITVIDNIVRNRGNVSLNPVENNEIMKLCFTLFDYSLDKNGMDEIFKKIGGILTEEEMITLLNNPVLLSMQDELKDKGGKYNVNIGSAVYLYCFLVFAEEIIKTSDKKSEETKLTQKYIMSFKNDDLKLKEELIKMREKENIKSEEIKLS